MELKLKAGRRYKICSCGLSQILPFCDNAHRDFNAANNTEYKSIKITPDSNIIIEVTSSRWDSDKGK